MDIILKGVDKGLVYHLCQELGRQASDVVAFGDNLNDIDGPRNAVATENVQAMRLRQWQMRWLATINGAVFDYMEDWWAQMSEIKYIGYRTRATLRHSK